MPKKNLEVNEAVESAENVETQGMPVDTREEEKSLQGENSAPVDDFDDDPSDVDEAFDVEVESRDAEKADEMAAMAAASKERARRPAERDRASRSSLARAEERERNAALSQAKIANESALISAIHTHQIFTDTVAAVEEIKLGGQLDVAAIILLGKAFKVIIPYSELFKQSPVSPAEFNNLKTATDAFNFMRRKRQFIQRMIGGETPFCLTAYEMDGDNMVLLGSRVLAMESQRRSYFGGRNPRYKVGDIVSARITSVNNSSIVVLVGGMDVVIPQMRLTRRFYLDLHDGYRVGQEIRAVLTDVQTDASGDVSSISLDPIRVELEDAKSRYNLIRDNGRTKAVITGVRERTLSDGRKVRNMYAYLPTYDLFARVVRMDANTFGRNITVGTGVLVRVIKDGHSPDGYLLVHAEYDFGNNGMFNSNIYR